MDKILNNYNWDIMFEDFRDDIIDLSKGKTNKAASIIFSDMKSIQHRIKPEDIKRSPGTRYLSKIFKNYYQHAVKYNKANHLDDLWGQAMDLDNYTLSGWKQQIAGNIASYQNN